MGEISEVTIVEVDRQTVLGTRKRGKYGEIATLIPMVFHFAFEKGADIQGPPVFVCHEVTMEEAMKAEEEGNADVEVAVPVAGRVECSGEISCYELPGGRMAKVVHKGPYQESRTAYEKLFAWVNDSGRKITGPTREVYLNDPNEVSPEELLTEIYAPIE